MKGEHNPKKDLLWSVTHCWESVGLSICSSCLFFLSIDSNQASG